MKYTPELKGQTFERWTIIGPAENETTLYNKFRVKCQCSCGTIRDVLYKTLVSGASKSCGCLNKQLSKEKLSIPLEIGKIYGKWTVMGQSIKKQGRTFYPCKCQCGTEREVERYSLVSGKSMSCGCLQSKGQFLIKEWLDVHSFNYLQQYCFQDCLSPKNRKLKFDFAVLDENKNLILIIEFQGSQHTILNPAQGKFIQSQEKFQTTQLYDEIKKNYLLKNKIPYLYIDFKQIRFIDEILQNKLISFKEEN